MQPTFAALFQKPICNLYGRVLYHFYYPVYFMILYSFRNYLLVRHGEIISQTGFLKRFIIY